MAPYKYKAFISYSRNDRDFARRLQRELEGYVLPKAVRHEEPNYLKSKRPLKPIFRDESELVPGQNLPARIREGLAQSESLIVVCSPSAARSEWVEKEILDFTKLGKGRRIIAVVITGEPNAATPDLAAKSEALPRAMRFDVELDGTIGDTPADPLWIDYRDEVEDRQQMFLRLVAALLDLRSLDELIMRERQAERRRRRVAQGIATAMTALAIVASGAGLIAYQQRGEAISARDLVVQAQMRLLTRVAAERLKQNDVPGAQRLILDVLGQRTANRSDRAAAVAVFQEARGADPQIAVLSGHTGYVISARYSPDGTQIVTASLDKTARTWNAATGSQLAELSGHRDGVNSAAYSPDGRRIVTASTDMTARIWDAATATQLFALSGHSKGVNSAAYSPDGRQIVTASDDSSVRIWDAATGAQLAELRGHTDSVETASYSPDGSHIVTASDDKTARVWDVVTKAQLAVLSGHSGAVMSAEYSPDGRFIVTSSLDKTARIWDAASGAPRAVLAGHRDSLVRAAYSPDGKHIVTASADATVRTWDAVTGEQLGVLSGHSGQVFCAIYSPNGTHILSASGDKTARIWDASNQSQLVLLSGHGDRILTVAYAPNGKRIVTASFDKTARIWDAALGKQLRVLSGNGETTISAAYSPRGDRIVTGSDDNLAHIWDAESGNQLRTLSGHSDIVESAEYSSNGQRIITASADKTARIWNAATGKQLTVLAGHTDIVAFAAFAPDGRRVITASDDKSARIWNAVTGAQLKILLGHSGAIKWAAYSPNGTRIVTASSDKTARVWDAAAGTRVATLSGHSDAVLSATYSPDGKRIVTGSSDNTIRLWDVTNGDQLAVFLGHSGPVYSAAYSPDGTRIVSGSGDKTARIWDARIQTGLASQIVWDQAAEFTPISQAERSELGLPALERVRQWTNDATACDQMAGAPYDPDRQAQGVALDEIAADVAVSACQSKASSTSGRFVYELGRALQANHDLVGAGRAFEKALSQGYRTAKIDLGSLTVLSTSGRDDPHQAISLFEQAWDEGVAIGAFELGRLYEYRARGKNAGSAVASRTNNAKAWGWYRLGAEAGEPNALARLAERDDDAAVIASDPSKRDAILLEAFRYYAAASEQAQDEDWPDNAWRNWRYRRATLARLLAREGMMQKVADAYTLVRKNGEMHPQTLIGRLGQLL